MKITVIGGGPGGLYFSILTKKAMPHCEIDIYERNKPDDSFGFGVVFSDETLGEFLKRDMQSYELIRSEFAYWDDIVVARDGKRVSVAGNGFCGCSRKTLLKLLHQRCQEEGIRLHFEQNIENLESFKDSDIIVAADGIGSGIRTQFQDQFGTQIQMKTNRFVWLGSTKPLDAFTYFFRTTPFGSIVAHTYQYEEGMSTWIFECSNETWEKLQFEVDNENDTVSKLSEIFKNELDGHPLITNKSHWRQFPHVTNKNWSYKNIVLIGDAKATAHYSIGSGTKLAMDCAIGLSDAVISNPNNVQAAFDQYEKNRRNPVEMIQYAATVSLDWFENMDRNNQHPFYQFSFGCMTRSKKVTYENLRLRDKSYTDKVLNEFKEINQFESNSAAFTPFKLRDLIIENRIAMSAMGQYQAENGLINDWHFQHYTSRALGGLGLVFTEMTSISDDGRITLGCPGIFNDEQTNAWKRINDFIHKHTKTKTAIQLGHAGRKSSVSKNLIAASPLPFSENYPTPSEMNREHMQQIINQFVIAAQNAEKANFDMIELQAHHGFLLATFLSPLTNIRTDVYGGSIENRLRFPLEVFDAIRNVFPKEKPISVRISATDWAENGITENDVYAISKAFKEAGADIINVSTGNTVANQQPKGGRMWQVPFADAIRNTVHIPTITTGNITDIDQINTIILSGKADFVALGKPLLLDPYFAIKAKAYEAIENLEAPISYEKGIQTLVSSEQTSRKQVEKMKRALKPKSNKK